MPSRPKNDAIFTPELLRILKIFGLLSIGIVLALSFFDSKRANNTGVDSSFTVSASSRLFFLNVRAINYSRELRRDAGMTLFRYNKKKEQNSKRSLDIVLILNTKKDQAYLYLEPSENNWPIRLKIRGSSSEKEFSFVNGNKELHASHLSQLEPWLSPDNSFYIFHDGEWLSIWDEPGEINAINTVLEDYNTLLK